ncbi:MAG: hypothetical protein AABX59_01125 [Nanoarchaeota archaeon]
MATYPSFDNATQHYSQILEEKRPQLTEGEWETIEACIREVSRHAAQYICDAFSAALNYTNQQIDERVSMARKNIEGKLSDPI